MMRCEQGQHRGQLAVRTARGEACGVAMGRGHLVLRELRLESYSSCEHEEWGAGRAVREG